MEIDHYLHGYEVRRQKEEAGHRLVAYQIYCALSEKPLAMEAWHPLPAIDRPRVVLPAGVNADAAAALRQRLEKKNAEILAARAAATTS